VTQSIFASSIRVNVENNGNKLQNTEPKIKWDQHGKWVWNKRIHNLENVPRLIANQCNYCQQQRHVIIDSHFIEKSMKQCLPKIIPNLEHKITITIG
jgi:hypothetical protein